MLVHTGGAQQAAAAGKPTVEANAATPGDYGDDSAGGQPRRAALGSAVIAGRK